MIFDKKTEVEHFQYGIIPMLEIFYVLRFI